MANKKLITRFPNQHFQKLGQAVVYFSYYFIKKTCRIFSFILTICNSDKKRRKSNVYRYHTKNETMNETKWNKQIIMFFMKHHIYETEKALCLSIMRYLI